MNKDYNFQYFLSHNKEKKTEKLIRFKNDIGMQYFGLDGKWVNAPTGIYTSKSEELNEITENQALNFIDSKYVYFLRRDEDSCILIRVINEISLEYLNEFGNWEETPNNEWLLSLVDLGDDYDVDYEQISLEEARAYRNNILNSKKITR